MNPKSCHDGAVAKGLYKEVGLRLRLNSSEDSDFLEAVDMFSRAFAISGHNYNKARNGLLKCRDIDRVAFLNNAKNEKVDSNNTKYFGTSKPKNKIFWTSNYDPRLPHQRSIISKNYHLLLSDEKFVKSYPRKSFVAGCRRLPNLMELLAPTVPRDSRKNDGVNNNDTQQHEPLEWGTWHCLKFKNNKPCDFCLHMDESRDVKSTFFDKTFKIHGYLRHDYAPTGYINGLSIYWNVLLVRCNILVPLRTPVQDGGNINLIVTWFGTHAVCPNISTIAQVEMIWRKLIFV